MPAPSYPEEDPIQSFGTQEPNQSQAQEVCATVEDQGLKCECGVDDVRVYTSLKRPKSDEPSGR